MPTIKLKEVEDKRQNWVSKLEELRRTSSAGSHQKGHISPDSGLMTERKPQKDGEERKGAKFKGAGSAVQYHNSSSRCFRLSIT